MATQIPTNLTSNQQSFGQCWGTPFGQDLSMPSYMARGNLIISEAILRRWTTTQGQLIDDPNYGRNVYDLVSAELSPRDIAYNQQQLAQEAEKDPRVQRCSVILTISAAGDVSLSAVVTTANGPFTLNLSISAVNPKLLLVQS